MERKVTECVCCTFALADMFIQLSASANVHQAVSLGPLGVQGFPGHTDFPDGWEHLINNQHFKRGQSRAGLYFEY